MATSAIKLTEEVLTKALQGEADAIPYYTQLAMMATDPKDKEMILTIRGDEEKHFEAFSCLYPQVFRKAPPKIVPKTPDICNYVAGIKASILDELEAYEDYRNIMIGTNNASVQNTFYEAMTDESEHAIRFNYLFTKCLHRGV